MRRFSPLIVLVLTLSTLSPALAAAPKPGSTCKTLNQKITSGGQVYTCIQNGSKKVWSKGVKIVIKTTPAPLVTASPSPAQSGASSDTLNNTKIIEGYLCDATGPASARDSSGIELFCTKGGDGKYSWRPKQVVTQSPTPSPSPSNSASSTPTPSPSPSNSVQGPNQQSTNLSLGRLGAKCTKEGEIGWNGNVVAACKGGIVKYALPKDLPANPSGTYTSRPAWYPTLTQIMMPPMTAEPTCSSSTIKFTKPVIPLDKLAPTIPYGMMVSDHVTPIDHAYLGLTSLAIPQASRTSNDYIAVTAPADGVITELGSLGSSTSHRVVINHGCNVFSVYMVLNKPSGVLAEAFSKLGNNGYVSLNIPIKAGEEFGRQRDNMLDFNVFDGSQWLSGFANVYSYLSGDTWKPYTADFLPFFNEEIRTAMEKQLQRTSSPRIGKIDQDVIGSAAGNWFLAGTNGYGGNLLSDYENATSQVMGGAVSGKNFYAWSHLAIAHHEVDTEKWIFSTGWYKDQNGDAAQFLIDLAPGQVTPDKLIASSGAVIYSLTTYSFLYPVGTPARADGSMEPYPIGYTLAPGNNKVSVIVQVNSDNTLSIEFGSAFTSAKRTYNR